MGIGTTIKNILSDSPSDKDLARTGSKNSHRRGASTSSADSGLTDSSRETVSDHSPTRSSVGAGMRHDATTGVPSAHHDYALDEKQAAGDKDHHGTSTGGVLAAALNGGDHAVESGPHDESSGFADKHLHGHHDKTSTDILPSGKMHEESHRLDALTHEKVRHQEVEEVTRRKEQDRHVHHVQHHVVPVTHTEEKPEQHHEKVHPVTKVHERHANSQDDKTLLDTQVHGHKDLISHGDKERTVIDKGTVVHENVQHHTHHVIQPIIHKETIDRHRIHTVIPSKETVHDAPIIHESQEHAPVSMETFLSGGGALSGLKHEHVGNKVLHPSGCDREVDGMGEKLAKELNLSGTENDTRQSGAQHAQVNDAENKRLGGMSDPNRGVGHYNKGTSHGGQSGQTGAHSSSLEEQRASRHV